MYPHAYDFLFYCYRLNFKPLCSSKLYAGIFTKSAITNHINEYIQTKSTNCQFKAGKKIPDNTKLVEKI